MSVVRDATPMGRAEEKREQDEGRKTRSLPSGEKPVKAFRLFLFPRAGVTAAPQPQKVSPKGRHCQNPSVPAEPRGGWWNPHVKLKKG